jgi:hypothetical protein
MWQLHAVNESESPHDFPREFTEFLHVFHLRLTYGEGGNTNRRGEKMSETWSGEFYCVKCKAKREATGEIHVSDKGTKMAKGVCPVCSTKLNRILGKA